MTWSRSLNLKLSYHTPRVTWVKKSGEWVSSWLSGLFSWIQQWIQQRTDKILLNIYVVESDDACLSSFPKGYGSCMSELNGERVHGYEFSRDRMVGEEKAKNVVKHCNWCIKSFFPPFLHGGRGGEGFPVSQKQRKAKQSTSLCFTAAAAAATASASIPLQFAPFLLSDTSSKRMEDRWREKAIALHLIPS